MAMVEAAKKAEWRNPADVPESRKDWEYMRDFAPAFWDGTRVPSFSQISLWFYGPVGDPDAPWMKKAQDRGKLVHRVTELDDLGELDEKTILGSPLEGWLTSYRGWRGDSSTRAALGPRNWLAIEKASHAEVEGVLYIVRPDRLELLSVPGTPQIWDLKSKGKTAKPPSEDECERHGVEVAAQALAVEREYGVMPTRACVYIWPAIPGDPKLAEGRVEVIDYSDEWYLTRWKQIVGAWRDEVGYDQSWRTG